jgi:eukaryotic-like serine/threonine-protein kinase
MKQTTESFLRMQAIFHEALELPEDQRSAFLDARCEDDAELAAEVRLLVEASREEEEQSEAGRTGSSNGSIAGAGAAADASFAKRPIGPYRLDRLIGRGGMGAVHLAHRDDGQFEQRVAIKLIDLPLATDLFRERFRQERQILAGLQHPYIARMLDGGITADGDLYLAMEYVDGVPIHRFCESRNLTLQQRLALFLRVCEAVQYAHQNLVVHRDLKPDNIFVVDDGTPRLLDFGTAKLLSPSLANPGSEMTREGYQSFTPQYASPEQVLGNPITTASDTYSLGVLLYLLVTGSLPYELKELTTAEMLRVICEEPPRKPEHEVGADSKPNAGRKLDPDLEAILMKALRKEPLQRYVTAEQLAADVQAWLDHRPVAARRGTFRYRASKFIVRHRVGIAAAALLVISLAAGIAGILWQSREANIERRKAEARSSDLRQLSNSLLSELDEAIKQLPGSTGVQKLLVTRVLEHLDRMAADAQGDRLTQIDLVDAYTRLANIQGNPYEQNLGDPAGALSSIGKAISLADPLVRLNPKDREALRALATAQADRGEVLSEVGNPQNAAAAMQASVENYDRLLALPGATAAIFVEAGRVNETLGDVMGEDIGLADVAAAIAAYRKSIDLDNRGLQLDAKSLPANRALAHMQFKIGNAELDTDPSQALKDLRISLQETDALPHNESAKLSNLRQRALIVRKEAVALSELERYSQANPLFADALLTFQKIAAADTSNAKDIRALGDVKRILFDMASSYENAANPALAEVPGDRLRNMRLALTYWEQAAITIQQIEKQDTSHQEWKAELASAQAHIASIRIEQHDPEQAETLSKALAVLKSFALKDGASVRMLNLYVTALIGAGHILPQHQTSAISCAEREVALTHRKDAEAMLALAQVYRATGQVEKSRATAREGLALLPSPKPGSTKTIMRSLLETQSRSD